LAAVMSVVGSGEMVMFGTLADPLIFRSPHPWILISNNNYPFLDLTHEHISYFYFLPYKMNALCQAFIWTHVKISTFTDL